MTYSTKRPGGDRRGSILILVVAVLALLAVIGTVYILSARTERSAANASATGVNLKLAQDGIMNMVAQIMGDAILDSNGKVGEYDAATAKYGKLAARNFDFPEPGDTSALASFGQTSYNANMRSQPWLVAKLHRQSATDVDLSVLMYAPFDPSTGMNSLPSYIATGGTLPATPLVFNYSTRFDTVVADQTTTDNTTEDPPTNYADSFIYLLPYNDGSGIRYRYGIRIIDTGRMANLNTGATDDTKAKNDTSGTYLTSVRLAPSSGWPATNAYFDSVKESATAAYLHTNSDPTNPATGRSGYHNPYNNGLGTFDLDTWQRQVVLQIEKSQDKAISLFDLSDELELRAYGEFGTSYHCRPAIGTSSAYQAWPYTLSVDTASATLNPNPSRTFPFSPPTGNVQGNPRRRSYTTYSFSRELRPYPDPGSFTAYTLTPTDQNAVSPSVPAKFLGFGSPAKQATVWPTAPARAAPNVDVSSATDDDAAFYVAMAATNMGTAIQDSNYTQPEACAYAANYVTFRTNSFRTDKINVPGATAYYLPAGPSYVDANGICVRSIKSTSPADPLPAVSEYREFGRGSGSDLKSAGDIYLGFSAQPFINEVAVLAHRKTTPPVNPDDPSKYETIVVDSAIELFNPFNLPLSLNDYELAVNGTVYNLSGLWIPANGFFVYHTKLNGGIPVDTTNTQLKDDPNFSFVINNDVSSNPQNPTEDNKVVLLRRFQDDSVNHTDLYAPVDYLNCNLGAKPLIPLPTPPDSDLLDDTDRVFSIERLSGNLAGVNSAPWGAAYNIVAPRRFYDFPSGPSTLGKINDVSGNPNIKLYDRSCENTLTTATGPRATFANIRELNHVMRLANHFSVAGTTDPAKFTTLSDQLANTVNATPAIYTAIKGATGSSRFSNEYVDAQIHFDFYADPAVFKTSPPKANGTAVDINAILLLDHIAMIDRVSDPTIDMLGLPGNASTLDINKIRLAGKINVNTASGDVVRALPGIQFMSAPNTVVGNILAYRARSSSSGNANYVATKDYSNQATYPGYGIRSLSELMIPINDSAGTTPTTLDDRDQFWASIYNLCTVRSDTFVVYGYLEAIKANSNPALATLTPSAPHNNRTDWYDTSTLNASGPVGTTDDPTGAAANGTNAVKMAKNIRLARLRWVAIVDRSFCNSGVKKKDSTGAVIDDLNFQLPRVVAIKDLPK